MKKKAKLFLNHSMFVKGDVLISSESRKVVVTSTPQTKWYHKLLEYITFGLFKPSVYYTVKYDDHKKELKDNYSVPPKQIDDLVVIQYLNDPERQDVIDRPQIADPTKPRWLPKHLLKDASGNTIGYWKHDMHYYENGKIAGFYPPIFLPPIKDGRSWTFDIVSGKFYIV